MSHRMEEIKPPHYVTQEECDRKIEAAIRQHNRNASLLSMVLGLIFLALFAEGFFRVMGMIPPFLGIDVNVIQDIVDKVKEQIAPIVNTYRPSV